MNAVDVARLLRVDPAADRPLDRHPPDTHPGVGSRREADEQAALDREALAELQERLWAEGRRSLLVVLQGMDTSGKGGTIEHVIGAMNPQGCRVKGFKAPTEQERRHHFLWRIRRELPPPGIVGIFDRSHYEDLLVPGVHGLLDEAVLERRHREVRRFEEGLAEGGTTVVKCMLHISYDEQRERLLARLDDPDKRWKFREGDIAERRRWPAYQAAYADLVRRHGTPAAPWYVVPADRKRYRNWAVGRILVATLTGMDPRYPQPDLDVARLRALLAPPN